MHDFIAVGCLIGFVAMCILAVIHVLHEMWRDGPCPDSDSPLSASPQVFQLSCDIGTGSSDSADPIEIQDARSWQQIEGQARAAFDTCRGVRADERCADRMFTGSANT